MPHTASHAFKHIGLFSCKNNKKKSSNIQRHLCRGSVPMSPICTSTEKIWPPGCAASCVPERAPAAHYLSVSPQAATRHAPPAPNGLPSIRNLAAKRGDMQRRFIGIGVGWCATELKCLPLSTSDGGGGKQTPAATNQTCFDVRHPCLSGRQLLVSIVLEQVPERCSNVAPASRPI